MAENSYKVSEITQRTLVALQQNGYILPTSSRLSDRIDAAVELLRLIVDAADGALEKPVTGTCPNCEANLDILTTCSTCGTSR